VQKVSRRDRTYNPFAIDAWGQYAWVLGHGRSL
jgi:hypothetical protein